MSCRFISGRKLAASILDEVREDVSLFVDQYGYAPSLAVVLASDDPASAAYVERKVQACRSVGIESKVFHGHQCLPGMKSSVKYVKWRLQQIEEEWDYQGILVQLPLANNEDPRSIFSSIPVEKDVDCFHPENVGLVALGTPRFLPCTPAGIIRLLEHNEVPIVGAHVAIINNSNIVGKPLALMLTNAGASVSLFHHESRPGDIGRGCREADVVVVGVGKPRFLNLLHFGGADISNKTIIDVGISRVDGKLVGDVHPEIYDVDGVRVTKVPGGVGPMTCSFLMKNTLHAARLQLL